jgi:alpha-tubulin suppressor-like RCC1 family protein
MLRGASIPSLAILAVAIHVSCLPDVDCAQTATCSSGEHDADGGVDVSQPPSEIDAGADSTSCQFLTDANCTVSDDGGRDVSARASNETDAGSEETATLFDVLVQDVAPSLGDHAEQDGGKVDSSGEFADACISNACGGCGVLASQPGSSCGICGVVVCDGAASSVSCQDPSSLNVSAIAAGNDFTCILTNRGGVRCWGSNAFGQLGDGTKIDRPTPGNDILTSVQSIATGAQHACALTIAGGVKCWGSNAYNQLGDGTTVDHATPVDVLTPTGFLTGVKAVKAGSHHNCVWMMDGGARCWGFNNNGQLGDGTTMSRAVVANANLLEGVQTIAPGYDQTFAVTSSGARGWGLNMNGQLGAGGYHTCALMTASRAVRCWGDNDHGQLGDGTTASRSTAPDADGLGGVQTVVAGAYHTCALMTGGGVRCWGYNSDGELGDGTMVDRLAPAQDDILENGQAIAAGSFHTCAISSTGVQCWGSNTAGQLGDGTTTNRMSPPSGIRICP